MLLVVEVISKTCKKLNMNLSTTTGRNIKTCMKTKVKARKATSR